ncbi:hypothetical protein PENDEC_c017G06248 [Penicillium decumbens]|uniref:Uncharacterized protein n=1 Tax=Penicillium decumbens TaxID=69771 RepID=A0A1V6P829_PENDC|nr:hypothetical protein PENDEC_c017G06248 [Penicillium decumbens]
MATGTATELLSRLASQVYIKAFPGPRNLSDSRQILASLQKFGEVTTFINLKYGVSTTNSSKNRPIVAIFESGDAADRARAASPLTVSLQDSETPMTCTIEKSLHDHEEMLKRNPFYGTYGMLSKQGRIWKDMMSKETGVPLRGLADVLQSSQKHYVHDSNRSKEELEMLDDMRSLFGLWREGMEREKKEREKKEREKKEREKAKAKEEDKERTGLRRVSRQMQRRGKDESERFW